MREDGTQFKERLAVIFRYLILLSLSLPLMIGYLWLIISTFSKQTHGLLPVDAQGKFGGWTLENWEFLSDPDLWKALLNTAILALSLTVVTVMVSSMAGYVLSRVKFFFRKQALSLTLLLHSFPSVTLLLALYFVLKYLGQIPVIGPYWGYNSIGGVVLISVAMQLPLGIWLMKGFFDNISWDIERSALLDGCSRLRIFWSIMLPMAQPGLAALATFCFITGWGSFLIPYTFMIDQSSATLATYLMKSMTVTNPATYGTLAAISFFQLVPIMIFFVFTQKHLMQIYSGGSKGSV